MRKTIFLISLLVLAIFIAGCKEQAGEAFRTPLVAPKIKTMTVDTTPPGPVSGLGEVSPTGCDSITWRWTNPAVDFAKVEVRVGGFDAETNPSTSYTKTGLTRNTEYVIYVTTIDGFNNRGNTKQDVARTQECAPADTTPPGPVMYMGYYGNTTHIRWNWNNPVDTDFFGVEVFLNTMSYANISKPGNMVVAGPFPPTAPQKIEVVTIDTAGNRGLGVSRTDAATPGVY